MPRKLTKSASRIPLYRYLDKTHSGCKEPKRELAAHALVDRCDAEFLGQFTWTIHNSRGTTYAHRVIRIDGKGIRVLMHRVVYERHHGVIPDGLTPDHVDHDGLNNQISNLRLATHVEQVRHQRVRKDTKTGYKGVTWSKQLQCFRADIRDVQLFFLGRYATAEEGAWAYNHGSKYVFKEFSWINTIPDGAISDARKAEIIADLEARYLPRIDRALKLRATAPAPTMTVNPDGTEGKHRVRRDSKTGYRGVTPDVKPGHFRASLRTDKLYFFGSYPTTHEAAVAFNHASERMLGDKAKLNVIPAGIVTDRRRTEIIALVDGRYLPRAGVVTAGPRPDGLLF